MKLFSALGLDVKILIAQFVNFALLLLILYKIGYKPVLEFVSERKQKIAKGLEDAKNAEQAYENAHKKQTEVIVEARKEAQVIIDEAKESAEQIRQQTLGDTKEEAGKIIEQSKKAIQAEKEKMLREAKEEFAEVVIQAADKVLQDAVDDKVDRTWLQKQVSKLKA